MYNGTLRPLRSILERRAGGENGYKLLGAWDTACITTFAAFVVYGIGSNLQCMRPERQLALLLTCINRVIILL
jgi:hypothetical protein